MSAPVLSWLFNISREAHAETQTTPCGTDSRLEPTSPESFAVRPVKNSPLKSPERQPFFDPVLPTQPLEPIFFPKLQIQLADCHIVLSTRGCSPWRPDAVMSTTRGEIMSLPIFQGPSKGHRTPRTCSAFPTVEPYLQIN